MFSGPVENTFQHDVFEKCFPENIFLFCNTILKCIFGKMKLEKGMSGRDKLAIVNSRRGADG